MSASSPLPVLDLSGFRSDPGGPGGADFVEALRDAFHGIGAAYLVGHGVPDDLVARVRQVAEEFFALPEAERLAIENVHSPQFRGYTRLGNEHTNGRRDLRDQVDIGREPPAPEIGPDDPAWLRLRGPNLWPEGLPAFRAAVSEYNAAVEQAGHALMRAVSLALGQPVDHFDALVTPPEVLTKIIRYPAPSEDFPTDQGVGAPHRRRLPHPPAPGRGRRLRGRGLRHVGRPSPRCPARSCVNIGELLQLVSNGYFRATPHRVVSPPKGVQRISIAYFFNPRFEAKIEPVTLPPALAAEAPGGESADPDNPILSDYGFNSLKVRLRAHPDVAARHHADLL